MADRPPARFITFEGGEGAGKSTQVRLLAKALAEMGLPVLCTREPGGAPGAERLRALLLCGETDWAPEAEVLLHFAARAEHVAKTIRPALSAGMWVICDRFYDSTMAYQGYGQTADRRMIGVLTGLLGLAPDLTLMLAASDPVASERLRRRGGGDDRYERREPAFHQRVAAGFRAIAESDPGRCVTVDGDPAPEAVHLAVLAVLQRRAWLPAA